MKTPALLLAAGIALLAGTAAHADSLSCQTVNGQTTCLRGSGSLVCETVNGRTSCSATPSAKASAEAPNAQTVQPSVPDAGELLARHGVSVERKGGALRVRTGTGTVDVDLE